MNGRVDLDHSSTLSVEATKQIVLTALDAKTAQAWICLSIEPTVKKLKGVVAVEKILLLTADAYFVCVYDYVLEKVVPISC